MRRNVLTWVTFAVIPATALFGVAACEGRAETIDAADAGGFAAEAASDASAHDADASAYDAEADAGDADGGGPWTVLAEARYAPAAILKVRPVGTGWVALADKPISVATFPAVPERVLHWANAAGTATATYTPPEGFSLLDFAVHPSGEVTVVLADARTYRLLRLDAQGHELFGQELSPDEAANDPDYGLGGPLGGGLVPIVTRDTARVAPAGESVVLAYRSGRTATIASRFDVRELAFTRRYRTVVEPATRILMTGVMSGTYDVFGQIDNDFHVFLDVDTNGDAYVAVNEARWGDILGVHNQHFGETHGRFEGDAGDGYWRGNGALVTRLTADGGRVGTTFVDTKKTSQIFGLRVIDGIAYALGRAWARAGEFGWDGYIATLDPATRIADVRMVDVDRGDALFDVARLPDGRLAAVGATGYWDNPDGLSISDAKPLFVTLEGAGAVRSLPVTTGPRHNELRSLVTTEKGLLVGGFDDGPSTHAADQDAALLRANGFVRTLRLSSVGGTSGP